MNHKKIHAQGTYLPNSVATLVNVELAFFPMLVTAVKQTTMMSDNITAYSTAVGPSSLFRNLFNFIAKFFMEQPSDRQKPANREQTIEPSRRCLISSPRIQISKGKGAATAASVSTRKRHTKLRTRTPSVKLRRLEYLGNLGRM
jgi:hypothetical protein